MEVQIPSPSVFLTKSPVIAPAPQLLAKRPSKPRVTVSQKDASKSTVGSGGVQDGAITKPKQSKSRNGTCCTVSKICLLIVDNVQAA